MRQIPISELMRELTQEELISHKRKIYTTFIEDNRKYKAKIGAVKKNLKDVIEEIKRRETYIKPVLIKKDKKGKKYRKVNKQKRYQYHIKHRYNISQEEYQNIKKKQYFCCALCHTDTELNVDHCHKSNKVRGLLCHNCNIALGLFKDNIETLKRAITYLEKHSC